MSKDNTPVELQETDLDKANGGFSVSPNGQRLLGNRGNDFLDGGDGQDSVLRGGAGNDI